MKYITKPDNSQFSIEQLIAWLIATDDRYNKTGAGIRLGVRIEDAVTASKGKPFIELQPDHHESLAAAAESPSAGFPPLYAVQGERTERLPGSARAWLPCVDAIKDAKDEPPKSEEPAAEAAPKAAE